MAKRFADTNKYKKPFMRGLPGPYKLLWDYLYLECDHGGVWHKDFEVAQLYIGRDMPVEEIKALELFNAGQERIRVSKDGDKWLVMGFAEFQYGTLNPANRVHHGAIKALEKFNVNLEIQGVPLTPKDKDMDKDKDIKEETAFIRERSFNEIWARYPVKDGKKEAQRIFNASVQCMEDYNRINKALNNYMKSSKVKNGFIKNGSTWFENWQDWIDSKGENNGTSKPGSADLDNLFSRKNERE